MFFFQSIRIWKYRLLSDLKELNGKAIVRQPVLFTGRGKVTLGSDMVIGVRQSPGFFSGYTYIEARQKQAVIEMGDGVWTNNNLSIICNATSVTIGKDTLIGWNVDITDSDFHALAPLSRKTGEGKSAPVVIEENVLLGSNVKVLKGVTIGKNSVIANGSVVVKSIPSGVVAGGAPARVLKAIEDEKTP